MVDGPHPQRGSGSRGCDRPCYRHYPSGPEELRIDTTRNGKTESVRYLPASANAKSSDELLGSFRWDGSKLRTSLVTDINKQAITLEEVRSLDAAGREMTVELTLVVEHGYQSGGTGVCSQNSPNSSKGINVFVKALSARIDDCQIGGLKECCGIED